MPTLTKRADRVVTLNSVTKAYDDFNLSTAPDHELWERGGMEFLQGSLNFSYAIEPSPVDTSLLISLGYSGAEIAVIAARPIYMNYFHGRFDNTNFGTLSAVVNSDSFGSAFDQGLAEIDGSAYFVQFTRIAGSPMTFEWTSFKAPFALDDTNQNALMTEISFSGGSYTWAGDPGDDFAIAFSDTQIPSYQVEWPGGKVMKMATGVDITGSGSTFLGLYGLIFDGSDTIIPFNIAQFDYTDFVNAEMIGNNQSAGTNVSAIFLSDPTTQRHLYKVTWTQQTWAAGIGTFDNTQVEYDFDDTAINNDFADGTSYNAPPKILGVAQPNGCNYMFCRISGFDTGETDAPYLVVISKDWDWYDKVTFVAGDAGAATILASFTNGTAPGNIAYNPDEGVLYFVSGPAFTYCTGSFDPCENGTRRRQMTKVYAR